MTSKALKNSIVDSAMSHNEMNGLSGKIQKGNPYIKTIRIIPSDLNSSLTYISIYMSHMHVYMHFNYDDLAKRKL